MQLNSWTKRGVNIFNFLCQSDKWHKYPPSPPVYNYNSVATCSDPFLFVIPPKLLLAKFTLAVRHRKLLRTPLVHVSLPSSTSHTTPLSLDARDSHTGLPAFFPAIFWFCSKKRFIIIIIRTFFSCIRIQLSNSIFRNSHSLRNHRIACLNLT